MAELRVIQGGLYNKLKISEIILEREGVTTKLNITRIYETPDGVVIKVV